MDPTKELIADPDELGDELNLQDPYSKITNFILYLHSCEFGSPPLYAELNYACRTMDLELLEMLGPFARALHEITDEAEFNKRDGDKIKTGEKFMDEVGGVEYNMAGIFQLWHGC